MHKAHGGTLICRVLDDKTSLHLKGMSGDLPELNLPYEKVQEVFNLTTGAFSPLEGFMSREDYKSVIIRSRLASDLPWTIPITLDVDDLKAKEIGCGDDVILKDEKNGRVIALMKVEDKYSYDKTEYAKSIFGTEDKNHPGVKKVFSMKNTFIGGSLSLIEEPVNPFYAHTLTPKETRVLFKEKGWNDIAGFQTRNIPHIGHEYVQKTALSFVDGIFINPVIGSKKTGDFKDEIIIKAYEQLIKHYFLRERAVVAVLLTEMRYAGPKEAVFHAIIRKNYGCTHFIIGRDHAGVGDYYSTFAAHDIFDHFPDLGITPIFFKSFFYCKRCSGVSNDKTCPHGSADRYNFRGTEVRNILKNKKIPPDNMVRPEVKEVILSQGDLFVS